MSKDPAFLYLAKFYNQDESFFKIGISVNKYSRFYQIMKAGYKCKIIYMLCGKGNYLELLELENLLHQSYRSSNYQPQVWFGGYTECYKNIDIKGYINLLKKIYPFNLPVIKDLEISWR